MEADEPKKRVTFMLPDALMDAMRDLAKRHRRSLNGEILWALEQYVIEHTEPRDGDE